MKVSVVSFSYPRGVPDDPDDDYWGGFVFDCRSLPDPHDDMSLRGYSGLDKPVIDFFERHRDRVDRFLDAAESLVRQTIETAPETGLEPRQIGGGAAVSINLSGADGKWKKSWIVPGRLAYHSGNVDWIHQTTEFDVPKDAPADVRCSVMPFVRYCVGEAWFDGLLLVNSH